MTAYHNPRVRPLNVSRKSLFILVARNMRGGNEHGQWQPASVLGFKIICASEKDAQEFRFTFGSSQFPPGPTMTDEQYEAYLERFIKIQPYVGTGRYEVWAHNAMRGWIPDINEILTGKSDSQYDVKPSERRITVVDDRIHV
jgi:hypothetical protein